MRLFFALLIVGLSGKLGMLGLFSVNRTCRPAYKRSDIYSTKGIILDEFKLGIHTGPLKVVHVARPGHAIQLGQRQSTTHIRALGLYLAFVLASDIYGQFFCLKLFLCMHHKSLILFNNIFMDAMLSATSSLLYSNNPSALKEDVAEDFWGDLVKRSNNLQLNEQPQDSANNDTEFNPFAEPSYDRITVNEPEGTISSVASAPKGYEDKEDIWGGLVKKSSNQHQKEQPQVSSQPATAFVNEPEVTITDSITVGKVGEEEEDLIKDYLIEEYTKEIESYQTLL